MLLLPGLRSVSSELTRESRASIAELLRFRRGQIQVLCFLLAEGCSQLQNLPVLCAYDAIERLYCLDSCFMASLLGETVPVLSDGENDFARNLRT